VPLDTARSIALALLGLFLVSLPLAFHLSSIASVFVDTISLAIALTGLWFAGQDFGKVIYGKITFVLAGVSAAAAAVSLAGHINAAAKGE